MPTLGAGPGQHHLFGHPWRSALCIALQSHGVHRWRPGIGSASAARQGGAWKGSAKYWVSCVTRSLLRRAHRPAGRCPVRDRVVRRPEDVIEAVTAGHQPAPALSTSQNMTFCRQCTAHQARLSSVPIRQGSIRPHDRPGSTSLSVISTAPGSRAPARRSGRPHPLLRSRWSPLRIWSFCSTASVNPGW